MGDDKRMKHNKSTPTKVPERLKEYADLPIFGTSKDLPVKQDPTGPFIAHPDIKLTEGESSLLSRDPKYSVMRRCDKLDFVTETERGLCKHRFN